MSRSMGDGTFFCSVGEIANAAVPHERGTPGKTPTGDCPPIPSTLADRPQTKLLVGAPSHGFAAAGSRRSLLHFAIEGLGNRGELHLPQGSFPSRGHGRGETHRAWAGEDCRLRNGSRYHRNGYASRPCPSRRIAKESLWGSRCRKIHPWLKGNGLSGILQGPNPHRLPNSATGSNPMCAY